MIKKFCLGTLKKVADYLDVSIKSAIFVVVGGLVIFIIMGVLGIDPADTVGFND